MQKATINFTVALSVSLGGSLLRGDNYLKKYRSVGNKNVQEKAGCSRLSPEVFSFITLVLYYSPGRSSASLPAI